MADLPGLSEPVQEKATNSPSGEILGPSSKPGSVVTGATLQEMGCFWFTLVDHIHRETASARDPAAAASIAGRLQRGVTPTRAGGIGTIAARRKDSLRSKTGV